MYEFRRVVLDFTNPAKVAEQATWSRPEELKATEDGLGWKGDHEASMDVWIENKPIAIGWSWRAVKSVSVVARVLPPGRFENRGNVTTFPAGRVFARFSPDKKHWSSWQSLPMEETKEGEKPVQAYRGELSVPRRETAAYDKLLMEYSRMDVPWGSDEEAAVKWILGEDPQFFAKQIPFIGYVQFLFETKLKGGQRLKALEFDLSYGAGGKHRAPKDPAELEKAVEGIVAYLEKLDLL
jgi:hypothetical protein